MARYRLPEFRVPGRPLGRHVNHDPLSLRYVLPPAKAEKSVVWERHIPILDQDAPPIVPGLLPASRPLGSCTGNAFVGNLGCDPFYDIIRELFPDLVLDEALAVSVYSDAEKVDGGKGLPGEDEGSSGLSVAKVGKTRGYDNGYQHATSLASAHTAIQRAPVLFGIPWPSSFDTPSSEGIVKIASDAYNRGGHEIVCPEYDAARDLWWMDNSWTSGWGLKGRFAFDSPTLQILLDAQGDITSLVPPNAPAPTPTPSTADAADRALASELPAGYLTSRRTGDNRIVRDLLNRWESQKGLLTP
jgi:hypothetical protein